MDDNAVETVAYKHHQAAKQLRKLFHRSSSPLVSPRSQEHGPDGRWIPNFNYVWLVFWNRALAQEPGNITVSGTQAAEQRQGRAGCDDKDPARTGIEQDEQCPYNQAGADQKN